MARKAKRGTLKLFWFPSGAQPSSNTAITQAEFGTAVDITGVVAGEDLKEMSGFDAQSSTIATQGMSSLVDVQVGGATSLGNAELVYYLDNTTNVIYDLLAVGDEGSVAVCPYGSDAGKIYTYHDMEVVAHNMDNSSDQVSLWRAGFAQQNDPAEGAAVA